MRKTFFTTLVASILLLRTSIASADIVFQDTFTRADGPIGNGWSTFSQGINCSEGIAGNKYFNFGNWDGDCNIYRNDIQPA